MSRRRTMDARKRVQKPATGGRKPVVSMTEADCNALADWLAGPVIAHTPGAAVAVRLFCEARRHAQLNAGADGGASLQAYIAAARLLLTMKNSGELHSPSREELQALRAVCEREGAPPEAFTALDKWEAQA